MSNNTRTNGFLGQIAYLVRNSYEDGVSKFSIPVTVVVAGQIITGTMVSEDEYFSFDLTTAWKEAYKTLIQDPRQKYLDLPDEEFNEDEFPDYLQQGFIFLKDAFYVNGDKTIPSTGNKGIPIQVRIADVVAFNFGSISVGNN
jgi:hypothetical protein